MARKPRSVRTLMRRSPTGLAVEAHLQVEEAPGFLLVRRGRAQRKDQERLLRHVGAEAGGGGERLALGAALGLDLDERDGATPAAGQGLGREGQQLLRAARSGGSIAGPAADPRRLRPIAGRAPLRCVPGMTRGHRAILRDAAHTPSLEGDP